MLILRPDAQIVLEPQVEFPYILLQKQTLLAGFDLFRYESGYLLDDIYESHRWAPVFILLRDYVDKQVPPISDGRGAELSHLHTMSPAYLSSGHNEGWLEGELVPKKYLKVEAVNALVESLRACDCASLDFNLYSLNASEVT